MKDNNTGKAVKAGIGYTIGNMLLKVVSFVTLPIFIRILTTTEFGLFNTYVAYEMTVTVFIGLCLNGSLRTAKYDYKERFEEYAGSVLFFSIFIMLTVLFFFNILYFLIKDFWAFNRSIINLLIIQSYAMFVLQFYNVKLALNFQYIRYLLASAVNTAGGTLVSLVLILYVYDSDKHIARILGYAAAPIIIAIFIWIKTVGSNIRKKEKLINRSFWKYGLFISFPLVVHTFSQQILAQFDRIMIHKISGAFYVGIYSFVYTFASILHIVVLSMDNAWSAWFYERLAGKDYAAIKQRSGQYIVLMNVLYIGFIFIMPDIMRLAGTSEYWSGIDMIVPLAFSMYFIMLYSLPVHVEYFYKKTRLIAMGTLLSAFVNIILNLICIGLYGYKAAAWTTLISYILLFVLHMMLIKKIDKEIMFFGKELCLNIFCCLIFSAIAILFLDSYVIRYAVLFIFLLIVAIRYQKDIRQILYSFRRTR